MSNEAPSNGPSNEHRLIELARRHYRPEPLTPSEETALLARIRDRTARRRAPRVAWSGVASTAAAGALALYIATLDAPSPDAEPRTSPADAASASALGGLLIPSEAYAADTAEWAEPSLPADYEAIEALLLLR